MTSYRDSIGVCPDCHQPANPLATPAHECAPQHVSYPHTPGYLFDCPACESSCHCTAGYSQCVFTGHPGSDSPQCHVCGIGCIVPLITLADGSRMCDFCRALECAGS